MNPKYLAVSFAVLALAACKKPGDLDASPTTGASATATAIATVTSADTCGPFVEKLSTTARKAPDADQKQMFGDLCKAVSAGVRACVVSAPDAKAVDVCMDPEKEKIMAIAMAAMAAKDKARAAQSSVAKLDKLGLALDVLGEVNVSDGVGKGSALIGSESAGTVNVSEVAARSKKTLAAARKDATELSKAKNLKDGALPTGFWLSYENTGSLGKNHFVQVQHDIGKRTVRCEAISESPEKAQAALAACKSLRASGGT
jgi:hypothetical protein